MNKEMGAQDFLVVCEILNRRRNKIIREFKYALFLAIGVIFALSFLCCFIQ